MLISNIVKYTGKSASLLKYKFLQPTLQEFGYRFKALKIIISFGPQNSLLGIDQ